MDYLNGLIVISISFAGGAGVGIAIVAFVIALDIIPRIIQLTSTYNEALLYEIMTIIGAVTFTILYLLQIKLPFGNILAMIIGLLMGIFLGMLAAALEEVLNVIPIIKERLNITNGMIYVIIALSLGKVFGSLIYWFYPSLNR